MKTMNAGSAAPSLGVVFVHGIGGQEQGQTIIHWGDPLMDWLDRQPSVEAPRVLEARLRPSGDEPSHAYVGLGVPHGSRVWLVAEGWWQGELAAPTYAELALWAVKVLPATLFAHVAGIARRLRAERRQRGGLEALRSFVLLSVVLGLGVPAALVVTPVLAAITLALLLIGLVPIAGVRSAVLRIQRLMTGVVGDSMMLINSPTHAAAMMSRVLSAVAFVRSRGCARVVVVAHSQGAAIAKEALSSIDAPHVDYLVTVGSGVNKLDHLRDASQRSAWNWLPAAMLLLVFVMSLRILNDLRTDQISVFKLAAYTLGLIGIFSVLAYLLERFGHRGANGFEIAPVFAFAPPIILGLLPGPAQWFAVTLVLLGAMVLLISAQFTDRQIYVDPNFVEKVGQWVDIYAHSDPVPNGATYAHPDVAPVEIKVHNLDSILRDHTYYSRAEDDALTAIGEALLMASEDPPLRPYARSEGARRAAGRRRWRVICLRGVRWSVAGAVLAGLLANAHELDDVGLWMYDLAIDLLPGNWIPAASTARVPTLQMLGSAGVIFAGLVAYALLFALWSTWNGDPDAPIERAADASPESEQPDTSENQDSTASEPQSGTPPEVRPAASENESGPNFAMSSDAYVQLLFSACTALVLLALRAEDAYAALTGGAGWLAQIEAVLPWLLGSLVAGIAVQWLSKVTRLQRRLSEAPQV